MDGVILDRASAYRGADLPRAQRLTRIVWAFGIAAVAAAVPFYPPTAAIGAGGWYALAAILLFSLAVLAFVRRGAAGFGSLLLAPYGGLGLVTSLQVLAGPDSPYIVLDLLLACCVGLSHPPVRALPFAAAMVLSRLSVAVVASAGATAGLIDGVMESVIWAALAAVLCVITRETRDQRLELHHERSRDALTGLLNRRSYDERLDADVAAHQASGRPLSLIVADVNDFKTLNDQHGHLAGDRQLVAVAEAIGAALRPGDVAFRWGGDEFAVLLPDTDDQGAAAVSERICAAVAAACLDPMPLTIGAGYATLAAGDDADALTARADIMLVARKRARGAGPRDLPLVPPREHAPA